MAEAVFRSLTNNLPSSSSAPHPRISTIDSAGTGGYHILDQPDPRTIATLNAHSITNYEHGARQVISSDFEDFDYILAMDRQNLSNLQALRERLVRRAPETERDGVMKKMCQLRLFGDFAANARQEGGTSQGVVQGEEVVDPYYGADNGFEVVFEQVERFSKTFLNSLIGN